MSRTDRVVFRLPWIAIAFPVLLFICVTPVAAYRRSEFDAYNPGLLSIYLIPIISLLAIVLIRTVADGSRITAFSLRGRRTVSWSELDGFEFRGSRWAIAVARGGRRFRLPMVRPRDLPRLAAVSGGRLNLDTTEADDTGEAGAASGRTAEPDSPGLDGSADPNPTRSPTPASRE